MDPNLSITREALENELRTRQEEYIKKERVYRTKINADQQELDGLRAEQRAWMEEDENMQRLRKMHSSILDNVGVVQHRTAKLVQEQESDLLRAFRARLLDVQMELEKEKAKADDGAAAWIERAHQLEAEVDKEKEKADELDRINQMQGRENQRLKQLFQTQEDDRSFLVKQLILVKKKNTDLRGRVETHQAELDTLRAELGASGEDAMSSLIMEDSQSLASSMSASQTTDTAANQSRRGKDSTPLPRQEADSRYKDIIKRISRMLDMERRHRKQVQNALEEFKNSKTPLEMSLRECIQRVARDEGIRLEAPQKSSTMTQPSTSVIESFSPAEREQVIEHWVTMDGVVDALVEGSAHDNTTSLPRIK